MIKHSSSKVNRINHAIRQRDMVPRSLFPWVVQDTQRYLPHISMNEVADTFGIPRKELLKYVDTQVDEARACQSLPFTCLLIVVFTAMVLEHDHPEVTRAVQHSLTANLTNVSFSYANGISHSSFEDIHDQVDFWSWVGKGLLPTIFGKDADEQPLENDTSTDTDNSNVTWLSFNRIVGGLRFRQLRSSLGECEREGNIPGLYDAECMDWDLYRLQPGIGLWNRKALQIEPAEREEWIFMTDDYNLVVLPWLIQQEADRWWSPGTVKVEITLVSYNGEYGLHTLTRVNLFFSSTGQVWRRIVSESTYADWHARWFQFVIDILWLLCLAYLLSSQGRLIYYSLKDRGWKVTFTQTFGVWQAIDFLVALWGLICVIVFLMTIPNRNVLNRSLQLIGSVSQTRGNSAFEDELATYLDAMEEACWQVWVLRLLLSVWPFSVLMRCFLAFASQSRMALVTRTFGRAGANLIHWYLILLCVLMCASLSGNLLFGSEVTAFTTISRAMMACWQILLGGVDWGDLQKVGTAEAVVWLWCFCVIFTFVFLNMLLGIIVDAFLETNNSLGVKETVIDEMKQSWARWMGRRNGTWVPLEHVQLALSSETQASAKLNAAMVSGKWVFDHLGFLPGHPRYHLPVDEDTKPSENPNLGQNLRHLDAHSLSTGTFDDDVRHHTPSEASSTDDGEAKNTKNIVTKDDLIRDVGSVFFDFTMPASQAKGVIHDAVRDYVQRRAMGVGLDEVCQTTKRATTHMKRCGKLVRKAQEIRDYGPLRKLRLFHISVWDYCDEVEAEFEHNWNEMQLLLQQERELRDLCDIIPVESPTGSHSPMDGISEGSPGGGLKFDEPLLVGAHLPASLVVDVDTQSRRLPSNVELQPKHGGPSLPPLVDDPDSPAMRARKILGMDDVQGGGRSPASIARHILSLSQREDVTRKAGTKIAVPGRSTFINSQPVEHVPSRSLALPATSSAAVSGDCGPEPSPT